MFLIVYGKVRTQIDRIIESRKQKENKKKEEIVSKLLKTKEGKEKLAQTLTEEINERLH